MIVEKLDHAFGGVAGGAVAALTGLVIVGIGDEDGDALADGTKREFGRFPQTLQRIFFDIAAAGGAESFDPGFERGNIRGEIFAVAYFIAIGHQAQPIVDAACSQRIGKRRGAGFKVIDLTAHASGDIKDKDDVCFGAGGRTHHFHSQRRFQDTVLAGAEMGGGQSGDRCMGGGIDH
ncbi:MAG: hypothetical protein BWY83_02347 [bacterium ADurb.Bin478]|nr:MAG: hypothetical protein BWY83_02347 [bacterium ADurb.Bin478]